MPGRGTLRWTQHGFLTHPPEGGTPRNLLGQLDGTANPSIDGGERQRTIEALDGEPAWFRGGTYMVFRKIRMRLPEWSLTTLDEQHAVIGRHRHTGAPLSGGGEQSAVDLDARDDAGHPLIATDAHVRLAAGASMLRRSFNYDYGFVASSVDEERPAVDVTPAGQDRRPHDHAGADSHVHDRDHEASGHDRYDAGSLFVALVADPQSFSDVQRRLDANDQLNRFIEHTGSAVFAIPPGTSSGEPLAAGLFDYRNPQCRSASQRTDRTRVAI